MSTPYSPDISSITLTFPRHPLIQLPTFEEVINILNETGRKSPVIKLKPINPATLHPSQPIPQLKKGDDEIRILSVNNVAFDTFVKNNLSVIIKLRNRIDFVQQDSDLPF